VASLVTVWFVPNAALLPLLAFSALALVDAASPRLWLCLAALSLLPFGRFVVLRAAPGIVEAGENNLAKNAMYKLREIHLAEDALRRMGAWDPDGDGIGSAGTLAELTAATPMRGQQPLAIGPLHVRFAPDERGIVCIGEYCFIVYVPPDDELAERRYLAYAWPERDRPAGPSMIVNGAPRDVMRGQVLMLDEHERIFECDNSPHYDRSHPPPMFAGLAEATWSSLPAQPVGTDGCTWRPWRNKQPSSRLSGDRSQ
jgi:hypothetical protein